MKNKLNYTIVRETNLENISFKEVKLEGYELIKNRKKLVNGVNVSNIIVINNQLIEKVINKKMQRKFKTLLELIAGTCENDEDDGNALAYILNEIERFRRLMFNEYVAYMNKSQLEKMDKKIKVIESEVTRMLVQYNVKNEDKEYETEKSSHRRR